MAAPPTHRDTLRNIARLLRRDRVARRKHRRKPEVEARRRDRIRTWAAVAAAGSGLSIAAVQVLPRLL